MSKFYTHVQTYRSNILLTGYEHGNKIHKKIKYKPYFFVPTQKESKYKDVYGKSYDIINFDSIHESRQFLEKYKDVDNFEVHGYNNHAYTFIYDTYKDMKFDMDLISVVTVDIEVAADEGFPDIKTATKEITAIALRRNEKVVVLGCGDYKQHKENVVYIKCENEEILLEKFLEVWNSRFFSPDIVTGWNCIPVDSSVWTKDKITTIKNIEVGDVLYDSKVLNKSPISHKNVYVQKLSNGATIQSSKDHKFPYRLCEKGRYTKLNIGGKSLSYDSDMTVEQAINCNDEKFVYVPLRKNDNVGNEDYSLDQCYLMGLIYTDGTLKNKKRRKDGFTFYQSDLELMETLRKTYSIDTCIVGPYENCYHLHIPYDIIGDCQPIYDENNNKKINKEIVSTFSEEQYMMFLSGMLDGDGCFTHGKYTLCNYNNDLKTIYELSLWNGIFSTITDSTIRFIDIDVNKLSHNKKSRWDSCVTTSLDRKSSQRAEEIRFKKDGNGYWVRVTGIHMTENKVAMLDIETDSHYFITEGVKTHNCEFFDIPYLVNRITRILGESNAKKLSPWGIVEENTVNKFNKEQQVFTLAGISIIDYQQAYMKFSFKNQESYKLDHIAFVELGEKKIDYSEYGNLLELYKNDYQKFIEYNIHDVDLVYKLDEKLGFISQIITIAYDSGINFLDAFTSVRMWDVIIHNHLRNKNIVIPVQKKKETKMGAIVGAYVKDPHVGMSEWIASFDLNSLYPHLIMQYNISPETLVKYDPTMPNKVPLEDLFNGKMGSKLKEHLANDVTYTPNGCFFRKEKQGFLPELMEKMYNDRVYYKKKMIEAKKENEKNPSKQLRNEIAHNHNMQLAKKIILNSAYGALSNEYFKWYSIALAEAVTTSGQLSIRWIERKMNEYINNLLKTKDKDYVIASDTDSIYITFKSLIDKVAPNKSTEEIIDLMDKICEQKIQPVIDDSYNELFEFMSAYQQKMFMKRECLADRGIWTAKKKYIMNVYDEEGVRYNTPKLKIMGIEAVRSSTPQVCRDKIKEAMKIIMNNDKKGLIEFISEFEKEFKKLPFDSVAFPRGVKGLQEYSDASNIYRKGTPIHVRGSLLYNKTIKDRKMTNTHEPIRDGDKIKFCYLTMPNPIRENVISCPSELPKEFNLDSYVDYDTQFTKTFIDPLKIITNTIDWNLFEVNTLDDFFG